MVFAKRSLERICLEAAGRSTAGPRSARSTRGSRHPCRVGGRSLVVCARPAGAPPPRGWFCGPEVWGDLLWCWRFVHRRGRLRRGLVWVFVDRPGEFDVEGLFVLLEGRRLSEAAQRVLMLHRQLSDRFLGTLEGLFQLVECLVLDLFLQVFRYAVPGVVRLEISSWIWLSRSTIDGSTGIEHSPLSSADANTVQELRASVGESSSPLRTLVTWWRNRCDAPCPANSPVSRGRGSGARLSQRRSETLEQQPPPTWLCSHLPTTCSISDPRPPNQVSRHLLPPASGILGQHARMVSLDRRSPSELRS